jgi:hypothetical protein
VQQAGCIGDNLQFTERGEPLGGGGGGGGGSPRWRSSCSGRDPPRAPGPAARVQAPAASSGSGGRSDVEAGLLLLLVRCLGFEHRTSSEGARTTTASSGGRLGLGQRARHARGGGGWWGEEERTRPMKRYFPKC